MTYQEFKTNTIHAISMRLGSDFKIALQDVIKNNGTHLDGLAILSEQSNISPTIYLNYYYEQYLSGKNISDIYDEIIDSYETHAPKQHIDISFFTDFNKVKRNIIFKLVNYERNKELLSQVPHVRYLDLAIIFNCLINARFGGNATILIYQHHLTFWDVSAEELYALAMQNTPKLLRWHLQNMAEVINGLFDEEFEQFPMYVLSNACKLNGSGCILYKDLLSDIAKQLGSDFYILPSSVHEVLLIPAEHATSKKELSAMVKEVNATQLTQEEILSDHVYYYSRRTGNVTM